MLFNTNGISTETNDEEISTEAASLMMEMAILESCSAEEIDAFLENTHEVNDALRNEIVQERTIVRLDKKARLSKSIKAAEFQIAKEKNDRAFRKLMTIWKMERELEAEIHRKYGQLAINRGRKMANARPVTKSSSSLISKAASNVKSSLNPEVKSKGTTKPVKPMAVGNVPLAKLK